MENHMYEISFIVGVLALIAGYLIGRHKERSAGGTGGGGDTDNVKVHRK